MDVQECEVFEDGVLKLGLVVLARNQRRTHEAECVDMVWTYPLFSGIGVVESNQQFAIVHPRKVLVEHCSLSVPNMQVATGLWWEPRYHLSHFCVLQPEGE